MISSTEKVSEYTPGKPVLVFDSINAAFSEMGTIDDACGPVSPRETPRFGVGSASTAIVLNPFRANDHARPAATRVFPTPPFPATAIFIKNPALFTSGYYCGRI